jgi:hypothetical protein
MFLMYVNDKPDTKLKFSANDPDSGQRLQPLIRAAETSATQITSEAVV